ncbi:MAG: rRNA adenine N-6-methyltransferase family protein [Treponema sp.]
MRGFTRIIEVIQNIYFDLKYGKILCGVKKTPYRHLGAHDTANTRYSVLKEIFSHVEINRNDVIADIGCGKGRVINYLLEQGISNKIYGIELDEEVGNSIKDRLKQKKNVEIIIGNVLHVLPSDITIFYMYNPFSREVMIELKKLLDTYRSGEDLRIVYYNCMDKDVFEKDERYIVKSLDFKNGTKAHECVIVERKKYLS